MSEPEHGRGSGIKFTEDEKVEGSLGLTVVIAIVAILAIAVVVFSVYQESRGLLP